MSDVVLEAWYGDDNVWATCERCLGISFGDVAILLDADFADVVSCAPTFQRSTGRKKGRFKCFFSSEQDFWVTKRLNLAYANIDM
ncbi:hypothetical protein ASG47_19500 [Devosia sp. Leaf420]|nr:hypothetical protein ASG47_19500 [Devosia sp. Leaf420]